MLYSVMIVEDEENTREGLANYVNWKDMGFQVAGVFSDGKEAIEFLELNGEGIHVILSDICMENITGLEVAEFVQKNIPEILVVLFSAYEEFEFAKKAISCQVFEYLLKPIKMAQLREIFSKVRERLDKRVAENKVLNKVTVKEEKLIDKARRYMEKQYAGKECTLEAVAAYVGVVPSYLSKLFKRELGQNFIEYLTFIRIEKAKDLLKNTGVKVHEVSSRVGYDSHRHFSKVFSKQVGMLPSEYRSLQQEVSET